TNVLCTGSSTCNATTVDVKEDIQVTSGGCEFDIGNRNLTFRRRFEMAGTGFIKATNAATITIEDTGRLLARGDFPTTTFPTQGGLIVLQSNSTVVQKGIIDVGGDASGTINITAQTDVTLQSGSTISGNGISVADAG